MPTSRLVVLPYKLGSISGRLVAAGLSDQIGRYVRRIRPDGRYRPRERSLIINYGLSQAPNWINYSQRNQWLNYPSAVARASNKLLAFQTFSEHNITCPEWTTNRDVAAKWISENSTVVCRTLLNGHSGRGIVLHGEQTWNESPTIAPLYVRYKKKRKEFRVHVFKNRVIDVAEKRRMRRERRPDNFDGYIRNHANGWIFARDGVQLPEDARDLAIQSVYCLGLDFGACDIIWNEHENKSYVLEVNTAPGLEGTTLSNYTNTFMEWYHNAIS